MKRVIGYIRLLFNTAVVISPFNVELADTVVVPEYDCVPVVVTCAYV